MLERILGRSSNTTVESVYADHAQPLWAFLARRVGDHHEAEDLLQETLLRAVKQPDFAERTHEHQRAWLMVVARNLMTDRVRSAAYRREQASDEIGQPGALDTTTASHDEEVLNQWLVTEALRSLSAAHRNVIIRAYYQDKTVNQIAEELQIAPGTVKSRMHHGMKALRIALQENGATQ